MATFDTTHPSQTSQATQDNTYVIDAESSAEMDMPDFCCISYLFTAWGKKRISS